VSVTDTGIGMSAETLGRVFEMFYQSDRALNRTHGGLGVGLTLARRLVEMHGGELEARSAGPGQGSQFAVRLPLSPREARAPRPPATEAAAEAPGLRRVLLADDNADTGESFAVLLRLKGHQVAIARDGDEAVEMAASFRPDVALLDIGMPGRSGYDVARWIREQPWGKGVLLIAATGWARPEDRQRSHEAGFDQHLMKPVDVTTLLKLVSGD
jgi:two-component system CheB/CheR fusion protein